MSSKSTKTGTLNDGFERINGLMRCIFRQHKCDHCLFSTNSKEVLGNHIKRVHEGIASHMCNLCTVVCW